MKIYTLQSNTREYSSFIQRYNEMDEMSIISRASEQRWHSFGGTYRPVYVALQASDTRKKNYNFDVSCSLRPFHIFSETAIHILKGVLEGRGEFLDIITDSKRKKFIGYYPSNALKNCLCKQRSVFKKYEKGLFITSPVLIKENIKDDYFFTLVEDVTRVFVTEKFKSIVEENKLLGFDFSITVPVIE